MKEHQKNLTLTQKDSEVLIELKNAVGLLLSGGNPKAIQTDGCSEDIKELAEYFNVFLKYINELYTFSTSLAAGNLDVESPGKSNFLAAGLKELRSRLSHLTWQVQQVAKGDYKQRVDFMGDFSYSFNIMAKELEERERQLKDEIEKRKKIEKELKYFAFIDPLTGISNRRTGLLMLEKELAKNKRKGSVLSICFLDVDDLKTVNDTYGHSEGDLLLKAITKIVSSTIRESDTLSRMGGDEFLIILPDSDTKTAETVLERIYKRTIQENEKSKKPYELSFSYGIQETAGNDIVDIDEFIYEADKKMYLNKVKKNK